MSNPEQWSEDDDRLKMTALVINMADGSSQAHYEISPREREDDAKRDEREFGTQEYDDDANRQDQRETRRDYED